MTACWRSPLASMNRLVNVSVNPSGSLGAPETEPGPSGVDSGAEDELMRISFLCGRVLRVIYRPLERVVCYLLPAVLPHREVRAARELLVLCNDLDLAVVHDVGLVDRWRHDVVLAPRYEE